jgi:antitoxin YefM
LRPAKTVSHQLFKAKLQFSKRNNMKDLKDLKDESCQCYSCTINCTKVVNMDAMTYSTARANLAGVMNRVCEDHEPLIITRNGDQSVVMLSLEDYKALEETAYLLRTPANARRLLAAVGQLNAGQGLERELMK